MTEQDKSQEVDLIYFLRPITNGLKQLWHFFILFLREVFNRKWWVIGLVLLAALAAYSLRFVLPKSYRSNAVFISHHLKADFCSNLINNLGDFSGGANDELLAKQLNVPVSVAKSIRSLKAYPQGDRVFLDEKDSSVSLFRIELNVSDKAAFESVQKGIAGFLENNEHSLKRKQGRLAYLNALKSDAE